MAADNKFKESLDKENEKRYEESVEESSEEVDVSSENVKEIGALYKEQDKFI